MFTGIVDHCGTIGSVERRGENLRLAIHCGFSDLEIGESVSVDGACLTVVDPRDGSFFVDLSPETLRLTRFGDAATGDRVNLERALRVGDRFGGHYVSGHVDETGRVTARREHDESVEMAFATSAAARSLLIKKGSVTVNGVSLTINERTDDGFSVMLIPHTLERTNLAALRPGDAVHIELDGMVKIVHAILDERMKSLEG